MQLMLCIKGTIETDTETGRVYESVGRFVCPRCGVVSEILEFAPPVREYEGIDCFACKRAVDRVARFGHQKRFIPLSGPGLDMALEQGARTMEVA